MRRVDPTDVRSLAALGAAWVQDAVRDPAAADPQADAVLAAAVPAWVCRADNPAAEWCPTLAGGAAAATSVVI
jgi:hypothetical protein